MRLLIMFEMMMLKVAVFSQEDWHNIKTEEIKIPHPKVSSEVLNKIDLEEIIKKLNNLWGREEKIEGFESHYRSGGVREVLFKKDLNPIRDRYLYEGVVFRGSASQPIYMSITQSYNCPTGSDCKLADKFFIVFTGERKHEFVRIKDVINVGFFMSGSKRVRFYDEEFMVKVKADLSEIYSSRVEVTSSKSGSKVVDKSLSELNEYMTRTGYDLNIESKKYKIFYARKVRCQKEGCSFEDKNVCYIVEYPIGENTTFVSIDEEKWNGKDVCFKSIGMNYIFNLTDGVLTVRK